MRWDLSPDVDVGTHSDVISQLHGALLVLICQVDTVQVLRKMYKHG